MSGFTQWALADRVACSRQTIVLLEQGRHVCSIVLAWRIARLFDATVEDVFTLEE